MEQICSSQQKDLCRHMASPEVHDWEMAKRIARYLKGKPRAIQHFAFGKIAPQLDGFTDSDWAGERPSMKSTSGGILMCGGDQVVVQRSDNNRAQLREAVPSTHHLGERRL